MWNYFEDLHLEVILFDHTQNKKCTSFYLVVIKRPILFYAEHSRDKRLWGMLKHIMVINF